jgi:transposase-like protein
MSRRSSKRNAASAALRERLGAIRTCEKSGESIKSYAERHGISVHSLYQAKKTARQQGLLPPHRSPRSTTSQRQHAEAPRFVEARTATSMTPAIRQTWRIRFASGDVMESDAPLSIDDIVHLAVRLRGQS